MDITNKDIRIAGVNQVTNYLKQRAFIVDLAENAGLLTEDTHNLVELPKGEALTGIRVVVIDAVTSEGSATVKFKASINGTAAAVAAAIGKADLAAGDIHNLPTAKIKAYDPANTTVIQMTVAAAALTGGKFLLIAETLPVEEFLTRG